MWNKPCEIEYLGNKQSSATETLPAHHVKAQYCVINGIIDSPRFFSLKSQVLINKN